MAQSLREQGFNVTLRAVKGKIKAKDASDVREYAAAAKPKTLAAALVKEKTDFVVSLMNLTGCQAAAEAGWNDGMLKICTPKTKGLKKTKPSKTKKRF